MRLSAQVTVYNLYNDSNAKPNGLLPTILRRGNQDINAAQYGD
jgi:hypothetical protein